MCVAQMLSNAYLALHLNILKLHFWSFKHHFFAFIITKNYFFYPIAQFRNLEHHFWNAFYYKGLTKWIPRGSYCIKSTVTE